MLFSRDFGDLETALVPLFGVAEQNCQNFKLRVQRISGSLADERKTIGPEIPSPPTWEQKIQNGRHPATIFEKLELFAVNVCPQSGNKFFFSGKICPTAIGGSIVY
jgi:hypothetical protein